MRIDFAKSSEDIRKCFPVIVQLRANFSENEFLIQVKKQEKFGYTLIFLEDKNKVVAVVGFRITESLVYGKFMYIDDLITDSKNRSKGFGDKLFDWLVEHAKKEKCFSIHLDSGVQRFDAHRFYLRKRMNITAHHFGLDLF